MRIKASESKKGVTKKKKLYEVIRSVKWIDIEKACIRLFNINIEDQEHKDRLKLYKKVFFEVYNIKPKEIGDFELILSKHSLGYRIFVPNIDESLNPVIQGNWENMLGLTLAESTSSKNTKAEIAAMSIEAMSMHRERRKSKKRKEEQFEEEYEIVFIPHSEDTTE